MTKPALAAAMAVLLTGCAAGGGWQNPNVPESQWSQDMQGCRGAALFQARNSVSTLNSGSWNTSGDRLEQDRIRMRREMEEQRQSEVEARAFDACMVAHGYSRTAP